MPLLPGALPTELSSEASEEAVVLPEGVAVSDALVDALRGLADEHGEITADVLCGSAGVEEGVLAALEGRIGPGPWPLEKLEALLGAIFGAGAAGGRCDDVAEEGAIGRFPADAPGMVDPWATPRKVPRYHWKTPELQQLEEAVDEVLRAEDANSELPDEPEGEHQMEAELLEAGLLRLQEAVAARIVDPIVRGERGTEEAVARQMLPCFAEDVLAVLRKAWRLAQLRGRQVQHLSGNLVSAREKVQKQQAEMETSAAQDVRARLNAAKCALKERDWALAEARRKLEQLERDRSAQERRLRALETASQRELHARGEAEQALAQAQVEKREECSQFAEQESELRNRLTRAEDEVREVREELLRLESRGEELSSEAASREAELGLELQESRLQVEELRKRVDELRSGERPRHRRRSAGDTGAKGALGKEALPPRLSLPARPSLAAVEEDTVLDAEVRPPRRAQKQSAISEVAMSAVATVPSLRGLLPPPGGAEQQPRSSHNSTRKSLSSLPTDLRGLGKILTFGGVTPRVQGTKPPPATRPRSGSSDLGVC